jgi:peroxiredoxin
MAATESTMLELGTIAPDFNLPDTVSGKSFSYADVAGEKGTVIMFLCNHCPYVVHVNQELVRLGNDYRDKGIGFAGISSNDVERYPDDAPDKMKQQAEQLGYPFPYLYDESQDVARAYQAACTPEFYIFDSTRKLIYRGQLDDSRPRNEVPVTGRDVRAALDNLLAGNPINPEQIPSIGCGIKWKP